MIDFDELEMKLQYGTIASREEFYIAAGSPKGDVARRRLREGLMPNFRAILAGLPDARRVSKLTEGNVRAIHKDRALGQKPADIAAHYGVSRPTIYDILAGRTWSHLHPSNNALEAS